MKTEAEQRLALAAKLNGAEANLQLAKNRHQAAMGEVQVAQAARKAERECYTEARAKLDTKLTAEERIRWIELINASLENIAGMDTTLQKAKSEEGTASSEVQRYAEECERFSRELGKLLPDELRVGPT